MLVLGFNVASADPGPPAEPYATAVDLVEGLYLDPAGVRPNAMFLAAARQLEDEIPWLLAADTPEGLVLRHGADAPFATLPWPSTETLAQSLADLAATVSVSGYPVGECVPERAVLVGMAEALDAHSRVLAEERLDRFNVRLSGTLVGIGASFDLEGATVLVTAVQPGGPAAAAGLRVGDHLLRVDGRSTLGMPLSEVSRRVRGDAGTPVALHVSRDGVEVDLVPVRAEVVVPNVVSKVLADGVGYVAIDHVSQRTVENLSAALRSLEAQGALTHGLVIDLRGNTGGSMKESARAADLFVTGGELLRTVGRDGGPVENLQARMTARDDGDEPQIPLAIVVDERTASGAEILAGALLELDRAVLIGRRTYGKGTVQKIYDLDVDVRFKLTVARYLLAHDRGLTAGGLVPDVTVGRLYDYGTHLKTFLPDESRLGVPHDQVLWQLRPGTDLPLELARRTVLAADGPGRTSALAALRSVVAEVDAAEKEALAASLDALGVDWSPPEVTDPEPPTVDVDLVAASVDADTWRLEATVHNRGARPLHQVSVDLQSETAPWWNGLRVPLGLVDAGAHVTRTLDVEVEPNVWSRLDLVDVRVRTAGHAPVLEAARTLPSGGPDEPVLRLVARLLPPAGATGPNGHPVRAVEVTLQNLDRGPLPGVEVHLGYPELDGVELLDWGVRAAEVPGRAEHVFTLATEVASGVGDLPLELSVRDAVHGELIEWPVTLAADGSPTTLQAPRIAHPTVPMHTAPGVLSVPVEVDDDRALRDVVVWLDGVKVAWVPGGDRRLAVEPALQLDPGVHKIKIRAVDDQGLVLGRTLVVHADRPATVDAGD